MPAVTFADWRFAASRNELSLLPFVPHLQAVAMEGYVSHECRALQSEDAGARFMAAKHLALVTQGFEVDGKQLPEAVLPKGSNPAASSALLIRRSMSRWQYWSCHSQRHCFCCLVLNILKQLINVAAGGAAAGTSAAGRFQQHKLAAKLHHRGLRGHRCPGAGVRGWRARHLASVDPSTTTHELTMAECLSDCWSMTDFQINLLRSWVLSCSAILVGQAHGGQQTLCRWNGQVRHSLGCRAPAGCAVEGTGGAPNCRTSCQVHCLHKASLV